MALTLQNVSVTFCKLEKEKIKIKIQNYKIFSFKSRRTIRELVVTSSGNHQIIHVLKDYID